MSRLERPILWIPREDSPSLDSSLRWTGWVVCDVRSVLLCLHAGQHQHRPCSPHQRPAADSGVQLSGGLPDRRLQCKCQSVLLHNFLSLLTVSWWTCWSPWLPLTGRPAAPATAPTRAPSPLPRVTRSSSGSTSSRLWRSPGPSCSSSGCWTTTRWRTLWTISGLHSLSMGELSDSGSSWLFWNVT